MKKLFALWAIVFAFGFGFGWWKNHTWDFSEWGYNSQRFSSLWWLWLGSIVTAYCCIDYTKAFFTRIIKSILEDERQRQEIERGNNDY